MLEQGVDRIVAQVVDPKIHHTFRPQVEKVVREFLSPGQAADESPVYLAQPEEKQEHHLMALGSTPLSYRMVSLGLLAFLRHACSRQNDICWLNGICFGEVV